MSELPPKVRDVIGELERGLKDLYGNRFKGLLLYGSYARGTAWEGSDVDLLLLLTGPVDPVREILDMEPVTWPLSLESGLVLAVVPADVKAWSQGDGVFLRTIRQDAVPVAA